MGYKYEAGVQGYINSNPCKSSGLSDLNKSNTTFQKRGYLTIKCDHDLIISKSDKSIEEQLEALRQFRSVRGDIDESGATRNGTNAHNSYIDIKYATPNEQARNFKPRMNTYDLGIDQRERMGLLQ